MKSLIKSFVARIMRQYSAIPAALTLLIVVVIFGGQQVSEATQILSEFGVFTIPV